MYTYPKCVIQAVPAPWQAQFFILQDCPSFSSSQPHLEKKKRDVGHQADTHTLLCNTM